MPVLRLFAAAREAAGVARAEFDGTTVAELLAAAESSFGERFTAVLAQSRVWVNGEPATAATPVAGHDVVAVLPPVSGGAGDVAVAAPRSPTITRSEPKPVFSAPPVARPDGLAEPSPVARRPSRGTGPVGPAPMPGMGPTPRTGRGQPDAVRRGPRASVAMVDVGPHPDSGRAPALPARPSQDRRDDTSTRQAAGAPPGVRPHTPGAVGAPAQAGPPLDRGGGPEPRSASVLPTRGRATRTPATEGPTAPGLATKGPAADKVGDSTTRKPGDTTSDQWWAPVARLGVVYDNARPHGRIGVGWAVVTVAAVIAGPIWIAAWLGLSAFVGASQAAGTRRALDVAPPPWLAGAASLAPPVAAVFGGRHLFGAVAAGLVITVLVRTFVSNKAGAHNVSLALLIGMATGTAAASLVLVREVDVEAAVYLLACACTYDAGAYLVGTGAAADWEGPVAGLVALIPLTIMAAVALVPPFPSGTPLALGLLAAVLAPLGPLAGTALLGRRDADAPGLRRLDSLMLLGPAWAWLIMVILR